MFPYSSVWFIEIFVILFVAFLFSVIQNLIYRPLMRHLEKTHKLWDDALIYSLHKPLKFLIWLLGITYALDVAKVATGKYIIFEIVSPARRIGVAIFIAWFLIRFIRRIAERLVHPDYTKKPRDKTTVDAISKLSVLFILIAVTLVLMQEFNVPISGVVAFGGGGAIVIGLAAKDILANFFGGLMIYLDRPFSVGDWIRSPDKDIEGTVEHIGWRLTRIRTFDKRPLYVPNSIFSNVALENPSRMTNRRIKTTFGLRYCDAPKVPAIINDIEGMLKNHPEIDARQTMFVKLIEFAASSLNFQIYTFTKTTQWVKFQTIQEDVFLKIVDIVYNKHNASMAYPTRTIEIPKEIAVGLMGQGITLKEEKK
jgi:MscS family membrane protein